MSDKRANSRLIKRLAETTTDGSKTPAKLADLKMMNGFNLLLMAGKETGEGHGSSVLKTSSAPLTQTSEKTTSLTTKPSLVKHPALSNSALLQLAEMCTSELKGSTRVTHPRLSSQLTQVDSNSSQALYTSTFHCHQPVTQSKNLAFSMPDMSDSKFDASVISCGGNLKDTNISNNTNSTSRTNLSEESALQKLISASLESNRYSYGRRLSSSETDSVPSPSTPISDEEEDAGSPIFSQHGNGPGNHVLSMQESQLEHYQNSHSTSSMVLSRRSAITSELTIQKSPLSIHHKPWQHQNTTPTLEHHKFLPEKHQHFQNSTSGLLRPLLFQENRLSSASQPSSEYHQNSQASFFNRQQSEINSVHHIDPKFEKNGYPYFQKWREPGKFNETPDDISSKTSLSTTSSSVVQAHSLPLLRLNLSGGKLDCTHVPTGLTKPEVARDTSSLRIPSSNSVPSAKPISYGKVTFASLLSEERIASLLSEADTSVPTLSVDVSCNTQESLLKSDNQIQDLNQSGLVGKDSSISRSREQNCSSLKLTSLGRNTSDIIHQPQTSLLKDSGSSLLSESATGQSLTFSKGKLKKTWTERMLVEARQEENKLQHHTEMENESQEVYTKTTSPNTCQKSCIEGQHIPPSQLNHRLELSTFRNLINTTDLNTEHCPESKEVKLFRNLDTEDVSNKATTSSSCKSNESLTTLSDSANGFSSSNSINHPKLLLQLSHNQPNKTDNHRFHNSFGDVQMKCEVSDWSRPHRDHTLFNHDPHHHHVGSPKETQTVKSQNPLDKNDLSIIAACGQKFMDHVVEKLYKADFSGDHRSVNVVCPELGEKSKCVQSLLQDKLMPEREKEFKTVIAGLKEGTLDGFVKCEDDLDYSLMTASSLVKKVIRKVYGSPEGGRDANPKSTDDHQKLTDANHDATSFKSLSPWAATFVSGKCSSSETSQESIFTCEERTQQQISATAVESHMCVDMVEDICAQPVRKSRRANRGQKYQELIKEGVIQPSRERLAAKNTVKKGKSLGNQEETDKKNLSSELEVSFESPVTIDSTPGSLAAPCSIEKRLKSRYCDLVKEMKPPSMSSSLDQINKTTQIFCADENLAPCPRNSADVTVASSQKSPVRMPAPERPTQQIPLPNQEQPVIGSRKRKARKHCITRISVLSEDSKAIEGDRKVSSSQVSPVPQKKSCSVSTEDSHDNTWLTSVGC